MLNFLKIIFFLIGIQLAVILKNELITVTIKNRLNRLPAVCPLTIQRYIIILVFTHFNNNDCVCIGNNKETCLAPIEHFSFLNIDVAHRSD